VQKRIDDETIGGCNEDDTEDLEDESDCTSCSESHSILYYEEEAVPSCCTEILGSQCDLNISILGDELDKSLEAVKEVTGQAKDGFDCWVLLVCLLNLLLVVLEDDTNEFGPRRSGKNRRRGSPSGICIPNIYS
jgi:hypothetical protein